MWVRQRPQQNRVNNTKNRSVCSNTERKHEDCDQSEPWILEKLPDGEAEIVHWRVAQTFSLRSVWFASRTLALHFVFIRALPFPKSFRSQRLDWVYSGGAPRWHPGGEKSDHGEKQNDGDECSRIGGSDTVEQAAQEPRCGECARQTEHDADRDERHGLTNNEPKNRRFVRAKRHADSDFVRPLRDRVGHHAINAYGRQEKRSPRKDRKQERV